MWELESVTELSTCESCSLSRSWVYVRAGVCHGAEYMWELESVTELSTCESWSLSVPCQWQLLIHFVLTTRADPPCTERWLITFIICWPILAKAREDRRGKWRLVYWCPLVTQSHTQQIDQEKRENVLFLIPLVLIANILKYKSSGPHHSTIHMLLLYYVLLFVSLPCCNMI